MIKMVAKYIILLLILPTIYATIQIEVFASVREAERSVDVSGSTADIISDVEQHTFHLSDDDLKNSVRKHLGQRPDHVFLRSPTPWGDLYLTYGWQQVARTLTPQRITILETTSQPSTFFVQTFINNTTIPLNFTFAIQQTVQNRVFSSWRRDGTLTVPQELSYQLEILSPGVVGNTNFSYTSKWGEAVFKSEVVTMGTEAPLLVPLPPFSSARAELQAIVATMKVQVEYEARLSGQAAVNYSKTLNGHHFWSLLINNVMMAGGLDTVLRFTEVIDLSYYTDSIVIVRDLYSNNILYTIAV